MPEAIEAVGKMLGAYPQAKVQNSYIGTIAALLLQYPKSIALEAANPVLGVPRTVKFPPSVAEMVEWLDHASRPLTNAVDRARRVAEQLAERDRIESEAKQEPLEHRMAVAERIKQELRVHDFKFADDKHRHGETPQTVVAKYNLTPMQWDTIPDAPKSDDYWQGVRWAKSDPENMGK